MAYERKICVLCLANNTQAGRSQLGNWTKRVQPLLEHLVLDLTKLGAYSLLFGAFHSTQQETAGVKQVHGQDCRPGGVQLAMTVVFM